MTPEDLRALHDELAGAYDTVRAAAEERVVETRWARGFQVLDLEPFSFERLGMPRPRLQRKRPAKGSVNEHGFDEDGRLVLARDEELWMTGPEWYRVDPQRSVRYDTWEPPDSPWRILGVGAHLQELDGERPRETGAYFRDDDGRDGWRIETYEYDVAGRITGVDVANSSDWGGHRDELEYDDRGRLRLVRRTHRGQAKTHVAYVRLDGSLTGELDRLAGDLAEHLVAAFPSVEVPEPVLGLALFFGDSWDVTFEPRLLLESDWGERVSDDLEDVLNPAEWAHDVTIPFPPELEERRRFLQVAVESKGREAVSLVRDVADKLAARLPDDLWVFAYHAERGELLPGGRLPAVTS